ncbi:MAG: phosphogluconate dehydrogenase (NAD(+)-dependent, decarboxylating) [Cyanobacteria bacterium J06621_11]
MQLGMIGLGRMGANIVRRLMRNGHDCVVFNRTPDKVRQLESEGAIGSENLDDFIQKLEKPRCIWVMVPAGEATESMVQQLSEKLESGDIVIDGGNSYYKDDVRRGKIMQEKGIHYVDVGTSGGVWGLDRGYCLMVGGDPTAITYLDPILKTVAPGKGDIDVTPGREAFNPTAEEGYLHCGPIGAGHFVKMVHNGVEYALMQSYAEGFDLFRNANSEEVPAEYRYDLNVADIAEVWRRGSVVGSWLLDLSAIAMAENPSLDSYSGKVQDSGEGRWTLMAAIEAAVPVNVLSAALYTRFRSRQENTYAEKVLSAMRYKFGGHVEKGGK